MIRIIAGKFKGRSIRVPDARELRPTSNKVREAIFDILGARVEIDGARFLDLYAGTGAVGLEALSRGAGFVEFVERDTKSIARIRGTIEDFGVSECARVGPRVSGTHFDIIFADPPYTMTDPSIDPAHLAEGGYLLYESALWDPPRIEGLELIRSYKYGKTFLHLYRHQKT